MPKTYRTHLYVLAIVAAAAISGVGDKLFSFLTDVRFATFERQASGSIVLVAIDPPSLNKIGVWPWPRSLHAELLDKLRDAGATDVVFDIDFSARQAGATDDAFVAALKRAGGSVVLPSFVQNVRGVPQKSDLFVTKPLPEFSKNSWPAVANVVIGSDGLVRRYMLGSSIDGEFHPSIGAVLASLYDAHRGDFYLDYGIRTSSVPVVSYVDVLNGVAPKAMLAGKKIIVGATAVELGDRFNAPNGKVIAGPLLQTLAGESLIQGRALSATSAAASYAGVIILVLLMATAWTRTSARNRFLGLACGVVGIETLATLAYVKGGVLIDTSLWQAGLLGYATAVAFEEFDIRDLMARIAESRFRRIAVSLADGLICTNEHGAISFCNPGALRIFGYESGEILRHSVKDLLAAGEINLLEAGESDFKSDGPGSCSRECKGRRKSGEIFDLEVSASRWSQGDAFHYGFLLRDISERKKEEQRIRFLAEYDPLTNLSNRSRLCDHLDKRIGRAAKPLEGTLLVLSIDRLKELNDTLGTEAGDKIICSVANVLASRFAHSSLVARLNGDEFAVVVPDANSGDTSADAFELLAKEFSEIAIDLGERNVSVGLSVGSVKFPQDGQSATELMANAHLALHGAKKMTRGSHVPYTPALRATVESVRHLEHELRGAFERQEFELFYQPQLDLAKRKVVGAEALIRWRHPDSGLMPPGTFLPVLETMQLSDTVGRWVIETACAQTATWEREGHRVRMGINLSPTLFTTGDLVDVVSQALNRTGVSPELVELEVTENILFQDDDRAVAMLRAVRDLGIAIAFDDFGTGFASLTHLKRFPIDRLKIDQTFVRDMLRNADDHAIVSMIAGLGKLLGMHTIAEGIEDGETAAALSAIGCMEGQGYHFGRPVPAHQFVSLYLENALPFELSATAPAAA